MIGKLRVTILGAAVAVSVFGVGGSKCYAGGPPQVGVNVNLDPVVIANSIKDAVGSAQNREGFVQTALADAFENSGRRYNVVVCNMNLKPDFTGLQGVQQGHRVTFS